MSNLGRKVVMATNWDIKCLQGEVIQLKEEKYKVTIVGMKDHQVVIEVFADALFGNLEGVRTQMGCYIHLRDGKGNQCPIIWKSKVARRVTGSTLGAEVKGMVVFFVFL